MSDILHKLILQRCPNYDFDQYRYRFGDIVETLDGAKIFVVESALDYVEAFILKSSFTLRRYTECRVPYSNLPKYGQDEFVNEQLPVSNSLNWKVGNVVIDPQFNTKLLLTKSLDNGFTALVLESPVPPNRGCSVFVMNPYRDYIAL